MNELALFGAPPIIEGTLLPYRTLGEEEIAAVTRVVKSGNLSGFIGAWCDEFYGGPEVLKFETNWAKKFGVRYAVSVNSNTSGLIAALGAIGLSPSDEVIVPPLTMSATVMAPLLYGGIPVFADVEPVFFCLDPKKVAEKITPRTRAILAVDLFGHPAALRELRILADTRGIYLIEDAAQAPLASEHGRYAGTVGHIGVFSLNYHKHIHAGEGGVCCTDDERLANRLHAIRNHGENVTTKLDVGSLSNMIGFNFRFTEMAAAIGIEQLNKIEHYVDSRIAIANQLSRALCHLPGLIVPAVRDDSRHVYYVWAARYQSDSTGVSRKRLVEALLAEGVPLSEGYVTPLYLLPTFQKRIAIGGQGWPFSLSNVTYERGLCPIAEQLQDSELIEFCICSYELDDEDVKRVVAAFNKVFSNLSLLRDL